MTCRRAVAVAAVEHAARVCVAVQARLLDNPAVSKRDRSPVTAADFAAQVVASHILSQSFPDIPVLGEEDATLVRECEPLCARVVEHATRILPEIDRRIVLDALDRAAAPVGELCWVLDPIDGTKGFLRGEQYAIALALLVDGEPVIGVIACPNLAIQPDGGVRGVLAFAERDGGASMRPLDGGAEAPIRVSAIERLVDCRRCESRETTHNDPALTARVAARLGLTAPPIAVDSQCKYVLVASGAVELYMRLMTRADYTEKLWDHAAGVLVIREAGGTVTDMLGQPIDFSQGRLLRHNRGIVASHGPLHAEVIEAIRASYEGSL